MRPVAIRIPAQKALPTGIQPGHFRITGMVDKNQFGLQRIVFNIAQCHTCRYTWEVMLGFDREYLCYRPVEPMFRASAFHCPSCNNLGHLVRALSRQDVVVPDDRNPMGLR